MALFHVSVTSFHKAFYFVIACILASQAYFDKMKARCIVCWTTHVCFISFLIAFFY